MRVVFALFLALNLVTLPTFAAEKVAKSTAEPTSADKDVQQIAQSVCTACHGADGNSSISLNPKLAGQHPEYIFKQLTNFKDGKRANAVMAGVVANLSNEEMQGLAKHYAGQKQTVGKSKSNGVGSLGEKIYRGGIAASGVPACAACHGATGAGIPKQYPRVAGQHADYALQQLRTLRTAERANAPMMMTIAAKMTDAEMQAVADYMQGLR